MQDHPKPGWVQWFAAQLGLLATVGIVAGFGLWLARQAPIVGIAVGCSAFVIGGVIGAMRLERWLAAGDTSNQDA